MSLKIPAIFDQNLSYTFDEIVEKPIATKTHTQSLTMNPKVKITA